MKQPWQIWSVFLLALSVVIAAMAWLSVQAVEVDRLREQDRRETEMARREAELLERINSALYRMDFRLLPLVSQEAARAPEHYDSFFQVSLRQSQAAEGTSLQGTKGSIQPMSPPDTVRVPSPLLVEVPEFVLLHFQIEPDGTIKSPRLPTGLDRPLALRCCGVDPELDAPAQKRISQARELCDFESLSLACGPSGEIAMPLQQQKSAPQMKQVYQVPAIEKLKQKLGNQDESAPQIQPFQDNKLDQQVSRGLQRGNREFNRRSANIEGFAQQQWSNSMLNNSALPQVSGSQLADASLIVGVMQPIWVDSQLMLVRRIEQMGSSRLQVCWLDWQAIATKLRSEVGDLLPDVDLQPIRDDDVSPRLALTTLPVQLVVDRSALLENLALGNKTIGVGWSGLTVSLIVAWIGLGLAAFASAFLLAGVISLSERRGAFVSAVTHELRTPLTTFRMYAEMLAEKMVPEEKTQQYANTLKVQADRLSHLVENVLQFARLERGGSPEPSTSVKIHDLMAGVEDRLHERANEADLSLSISIDRELGTAELQTHAAQIEQILFNLVDNACKYGKPVAGSDAAEAVADIQVSVQSTGHHVTFRVCDHGPGVAPRNRRKMFQAFCKSDQEAANTAPGVGLGLALCRRMAQSLRGRLYLEDGDDRGACFVLELPR